MLSAICLAAPASAGTYLVCPDGSGDFTTIQAAIDAGADWDVIELCDDTFTGNGNRDITYRGKLLTVRSRSGNPTQCIIDCGGTEIDPHRGFHFHSGEGSEAVLEGVTIQNGNLSGEQVLEDGGGVCCEGSASPSIVRCIITGNHAVIGAGLYCADSASPTLEGCSFIDNACHGLPGGGAGGGIACLQSSSVTLEDCVVLDNSAYRAGGIYLMDHACATLNRCILAYNTGALFGGGIGCEDSTSLHLSHCTLVGNHSPAGQGSGIAFWSDGSILVEHTIAAYSMYGTWFQALEPTFRCCDVFGNDGGDWIGSIADQYGVEGNFSEDPRFCDVEQNDFTLHRDSPCLPDNHPDGPGCGLIGAHPVGCPMSSVDENPLSPASSRLLVASPNPFSCFTQIQYAVTGGCGKPPALCIYDLMGRRVATIVKVEHSVGTHQVIWDGTDEMGSDVAEGVYFCVQQTSNEARIRRLVRIR
jgi:hypothetical protein